jgi:photosystem II stability/assembly factor-like uncharacterized protein
MASTALFLNSQPLLDADTEVAAKNPGQRRYYWGGFFITVFVFGVVGLILFFVLPGKASSAPLVPRSWMAVTSSADGNKLVALDRTNAITVYVSDDGGATWAENLKLGGYTAAVASSANGTWLIVAVYGDRIYTSSDSAQSWVPRTQHDVYSSWQSVATSADGKRSIAVDANAIYTSADYGQTWVAQGPPPNWHTTSCCWSRAASSADGSHLVIAPTGNSSIYTSEDYGATWVPRDNPRNWLAVASSANGSHLVACTWSLTSSCCSQIFTSDDYGISFVPRGSLHNFTNAVASSADGSTLIALSAPPDRLSVSLDFGVTWVPRESPRQWTSAASSADGKFLIAVASGPDQIYTSSDSGVTWKAVF